MTNVEKAIEILKTYEGANSYILSAKKKLLFNPTYDPTDYEVEYVLANHNYKPIEVNKIVKISRWYSGMLKEKLSLEFDPKVLKIYRIVGETEKSYHALAQYRKSVEPSLMFIPKVGIVTDMFATDFNKMEVDFDYFDRLSMEKDVNRKMTDMQKTGVKFLLSRKKCILADSMGLGKCEPVSALIPTPYGFKKMGDIKLNDKVFGQDGKPHTVLAVYPHKDKAIYKVTFSDHTTAECGLEHLWTVRDGAMRVRKKGWKVLSLEQMMKMGFQVGKNPHCNKFEIPVTEPVDYEPKEYLIHPYVLGVCIGDGSMCDGKSICISIPDYEIETSDRIKKLLNEDYCLHENRRSSCPRYSIVTKHKTGCNEYIREIKRLGLNVKGEFKFIPEEYKLGSIEQRFELLQGLMDSDGTISKERNRITYYTNSKKLAEDVQELVYSLGGTAKMRVYDRTKEGKNIEYSVAIQIKRNPFKLEHKRIRYNPTFKKYCHKYIVSAEYVRNEDAQCIMVDSDEHTYLTGKNYIVTHNTTTLSVAAIEGKFDAVLIICPASIKTNWKRELMWYVPEEDITIIDAPNGKNKAELETFLGYEVGKSRKRMMDLMSEASGLGRWKDNRFVIINYDILDDFYKLNRARTPEAQKKAFDESPLLKYIYGKKSLIIIDEAHQLSSGSSTRYKVVKNLIKKGNPDSIYLATGTPVTNNPKGLFYLLHLIENNITSNYEQYMENYCGANKMPINKLEAAKRRRITEDFCQQLGKLNWYMLTNEEKKRLEYLVSKKVKMRLVAQRDCENLDELSEKISTIYLRRVKEDLGCLPPKRVHELFYDLTLQQMAEYDRLWSEYEEQRKAENPDIELNQALLEGAVYRNYLSKQMVPNTTKLVDKMISEGRKVVIACCYDEELYTLQEYYGDRCVIYNGKMNLKKKDEAIEKFTNDPNVMVFIGNIDAASMGITLIVSHDMVFNNISYTAALDRQMEDRVYRLGQYHDVDIYYQIFNDTQYRRMWDIVLRKDLIANEIIKKEEDK